LLDPADLPRPAALGVIASMQPYHAVSDMDMVDRWWGKRAALSYAWNGLLQSGATLAFGSDAPVEKPNPFWGLHAAVTRRRQDGTPGPDGWIQEQRIDLADALQAYTVGPAYAAGLETLIGRLRPGYLADLLVLEDDPFEVDPQDLFRLQPVATMVGGEWVYGEAW
jgi:predicted amidohydrolase YtcJ